MNNDSNHTATQHGKHHSKLLSLDNGKHPHTLIFYWTTGGYAEQGRLQQVCNKVSGFSKHRHHVHMEQHYH